MSFGILRESRDSVSTTYGAKDFADWENSKTDSAEISKIWNPEFDKAPGAPVNRPEPVKTGSNQLTNHQTIPTQNDRTQNRLANHNHSPFKNVSYDNRNSSPIGQSINQSKFANLSINSNGKQQNVFIGGQQNGNINLLNIQNTSHVVGHVTPTVTTVGSNFTTTSNFMFNNNQYQIQRNFKQPVQATGMTYNAQQPQQPNGIRNTFIIAKPPIQQVQTAPIVTTAVHAGPRGQYQIGQNQAFVQNHQFQNRRCRSVQQTNLHYALSDCQEQFNDLKSELKLRKHCERDNLKTEELCHQFDQVVLPELMSKLERCNEKHWKHLEVDIKLKIDKCKTARNKEKKASNTGGNRGLESATEGVTESLIELTRCLRICRTLLWASQVPLREYPPRLGYSHSNPSIGNNMTGNGSGNLPSSGGNQNDERNPFQ